MYAEHGHHMVALPDKRGAQVMAGVAADGRMIVNRAMSEAGNYKK